MYRVSTEIISPTPIYLKNEITQDSERDGFHDVLQCTERFDNMELENRECVPGAWRVAAQILSTSGEAYKVRTDLEVMDVRMVNGR
uniref:DUF3599 family protein n=1 Tax=Heterorhabditis bacteriophora TaxID=37862 RepID=A0A1I7XGI8_HETBA